MKNKNNDIKIILAIAITATVIRLFLTKALMVYFSAGTQYDDLMQIAKEFEISNGNWLGAYTSTTLVKGAGYPLVTAFFHLIHMPYILGYNIIYCIAAAAFAAAIYPLIKSKWIVLTAYLFVLYNPIAFSNSINRYYRDILYYSIALLAVSTCIMCITLRKKYAFFLSGVFAAFAITIRDDSQWLVIYCVCCMLTGLVYYAFMDKKINLKRCLVNAILTLCGVSVIVVPICAMNYAYYSVFTIDEYTMGAFPKAYGALSRLDCGREDSRTTICYDERMKLYDASPAFNRLYPLLDAENAPFSIWKEIQGEYRTGYFSFTLREAAWASENFKNGKEAEAYFEVLAKEVNAYCETVELAGPRKSTIAARLYKKDIGSVIVNAFSGIYQTARYTNVSCIPIQCEEDDTYLRIFEDYTNSVCAGNRYMTDGTIEENYHLLGVNRWCQRFVRLLILAYSILTLPLLLVSCGIWILQFVCDMRKRQLSLTWIVSSSLLCAFLVRSAMIGFVDTTMFPAIGNPCYQAASYSCMIAFIALQAAWICGKVLQNAKLKSRHERFPF